MKLYQSVLWAESERYAPGCQVSWWAMSYAVWRNEALYHMPEEHKVDVLGMQHRDRWSISCVLTIHRPQLLCRDAQTANWYLSLNVLEYRYKKQGLCPCAQNEKYEKYMIIIEQNIIFTRARAADMSSIFWFLKFCLLHISISFYKMILVKFCSRKNL